MVIICPPRLSTKFSGKKYFHLYPLSSRNTLQPSLCLSTSQAAPSASPPSCGGPKTAGHPLLPTVLHYPHTKRIDSYYLNGVSVSVLGCWGIVAILGRLRATRHPRRFRHGHQTAPGREAPSHLRTTSKYPFKAPLHEK